MRRKIKISIVLYIMICVLLFFISKSVLILILLGGIIVVLLATFVYILNKLYKKTYHWKNLLSFKENFISNNGYRDNISRNFDIVNVGSNPAKYGFFYEKVRGQNWATGSQGFPMDFEILKYYHSYIKEGGYILIPIMPFSSVAQFLETRPEYWSDTYYLKFASILDKNQIEKFPNGNKLIKMVKYPLIFKPEWIKYIFHDVESDISLNIDSQTMTALQLEQDARMKIKSWEIEFCVKNIMDVLGSEYEKYYAEGVKLLRDIIDFCLMRDLNPVIVTIPMSKYLGDLFPQQYRDEAIYQFIEAGNIKAVPVLDYMFDEKYSNPALFNGSFYLNLRGRKEFTNQVLKDLNLK